MCYAPQNRGLMLHKPPAPPELPAGIKIHPPWPALVHLPHPALHTWYQDVRSHFPRLPVENLFIMLTKKYDEIELGTIRFNKTKWISLS